MSNNPVGHALAESMPRHFNGMLVQRKIDVEFTSYPSGISLISIVQQGARIVFLARVENGQRSVAVHTTYIYRC